eukprot:6204188-Lingulodinium_polyedra.AAC.1
MAESLSVIEAATDQVRRILRASREAQRLADLPWQLAQSLPVRERGEEDRGAASAAQAAPVPRPLRDRGFAEVGEHGPGSVL